jgi:hypothetical protein
MDLLASRRKEACEYGEMISAGALRVARSSPAKKENGRVTGA